MKSLKKIIEAWSNHGGWQPKAGDEQRFKDLHTVKLFDNLYSKPEYDKLFKGSTTYHARVPHHGYDPRDDEAAYDGGASKRYEIRKEDTDLDESGNVVAFKNPGRHAGGDGPGAKHPSHVMYKDKLHKVVSVHPKGSARTQTDYKTGENKVVGKHDETMYTIQKVHGKAEWPKKVPMKHTTPMHKEEVSENTTTRRTTTKKKTVKYAKHNPRKMYAVSSYKNKAKCEDVEVTEADDPRGKEYEAGVEKARANAKHHLTMKALRDKDPVRKARMSQASKYDEKTPKINNKTDPKVVSKIAKDLAKDHAAQKKISSGKS